jgi:serine phosphatase RsbU (regulator of sigma subunit)
MGQINAALADDIGEGRFVTFVAAVCAPRSPFIELLSAGHGPQFLYVLKEDSSEEMGAQGLPLGIVARLVSEPPRVLTLNHGDLLVLATDGFFEWVNLQGELFGPKKDWKRSFVLRKKSILRKSSPLCIKPRLRFPVAPRSKMI